MAGTDPPPAPPWVFQQPADIVIEQIAAMSDRADASLALANATTVALGNVNIQTESTAVPQIEFPNIPSTSIKNPDKAQVLNLGTIDPYVDPSFDLPTDILAQLDRILASIPTVATFESPISNLFIPAPPPPIDTSGRPDRSALQFVPVTVPNDPGVPVVSLGPLLDITLPVPLNITFPDFVDSDSTFQGTAVDTVLHWVEPTYTTVMGGPLKDTVVAMLGGSFAMPAAVMDAMFSQSRQQEDQTAQKSYEESFELFASSGWGMLTGPLIEQVNVAREQNQLAVNEKARDILQKSAQWEIDNLRAAVQSGVTYEGMLIQQFENTAKRVFDAGKARLEADTQMFGHYVSLFNARQAARQVQVAILNAKLGQINTRLEVWKATLAEEQLKGTLNENTARIYATTVEAAKNLVSIFSIRMEGAKVESEINKNIIDGYKADTESYASLMSARKTVYDAYESQMKGVEAEGHIVEAYARAFAATVEAQSALANVKVQVVRGKVESLGYATQKFVAQSTGERDKITSQATGIDAKARAFTADVQRYSAELSHNTEETRLGVTVAEARLRNNLAYYETRVREYDQSLNRLIERARIIVQALTATGQINAQLAAGAMAAMHVQASLSGHGQAGTSWSDSFSYNENHNFEE
jgi:hypothetical protein